MIDVIGIRVRTCTGWLRTLTEPGEIVLDLGGRVAVVGVELAAGGLVFRWLEDECVVWAHDQN